MALEPFDTSSTKKIPKKELKELLGLLIKTKTKKSLELSIKLFDQIQTTGETIQAGAGGIIESIFNKMITSSGLMGPFNTLLSLIGASTAQASAEAMKSLYELVTSDATISAIDTATESFGLMMDGLATGLESASGFSVTVGGVSFSPFDTMIEGFAAFLGGGLFGAASAFIGTLGELLLQLGKPAPPPGPPLDPIGAGVGPGIGGPGVGMGPGVIGDFIGDLPGPAGGHGPGGGNGPFTGGGAFAGVNARLDRLIQLQEDAWG